MDRRFVRDYVLSLCTSETRINARQLRLIASGKRTPSNLYLTEKNELYALFLSPLEVLSEKQWEKLLSDLEEKKYLVKENGSWSLSPEGKKAKKEFLRQYPTIYPVKTLRYALTRRAYWKRFLFVSQVLSELSYCSSQYLPVINDPAVQKQIKSWLGLHKGRSADLCRQWAEELIIFLNEQTDETRHLLLDQLTGYNSEAHTQRQLSEKYDTPYLSIELINHHLMESVQGKREKLPLLFSLFQQVDRLNCSGLSESTHKSIHYFHKGLPLSKVAKIRQLKTNTIKEHLLEYVLVSHWGDYGSYIPSDVGVRLHELFDQRPMITYREAHEEIRELDFFWFRLIEIERMRMKRWKSRESVN